MVDSIDGTGRIADPVQVMPAVKVVFGVVRRERERAADRGERRLEPVPLAFRGRDDGPQRGRRRATSGGIAKQRDGIVEPAGAQQQLAGMNGDIAVRRCQRRGLRGQIERLVGPVERPAGRGQGPQRTRIFRLDIERPGKIERRFFDPLGV